jgi:Zn-dependent M28 family amino/carboxypeptidase
MISIDMIGYDDTASPPYVVIGRKNRKTSSVGRILGRAVETYTGLIPYERYGYGLSDHIPFQQAGIDSVHLMEYDFIDYWHPNGPTFSENPHYHSDSDSIDTPGYISYDYATETTRAVVGYLCDQAGLKSTN